MNARCVAHDLYMIGPWPLERRCWRQFATQWGDWKNLELHLLMRSLGMTVWMYLWMSFMSFLVEMLRGSSSFLNIDRPGCHSADRLKERGMEKGSGHCSTLYGGEWSLFNQTLELFWGQPWKDWRDMVFPCNTLPSWAEHWIWIRYQILLSLQIFLMTWGS